MSADKGVIDKLFVSRHYGQRTHQPVLSEMLNLTYLCHAVRNGLTDAIGFGPLCRACQFLAANIGQRGAVYPQ